MTVVVSWWHLLVAVVFAFEFGVLAGVWLLRRHLVKDLGFDPGELDDGPVLGRKGQA